MPPSLIGRHLANLRSISRAARSPLASAPCTVPSSNTSPVASPAKNNTPPTARASRSGACSAPATAKLYAPRVNGSAAQSCVRASRTAARTCFSAHPNNFASAAHAARTTFASDQPDIAAAAGPPVHPTNTGLGASDHHTGNASSSECINPKARPSRALIAAGISPRRQISSRILNTTRRACPLSMFANTFSFPASRGSNRTAPRSPSFAFNTPNGSVTNAHRPLHPSPRRSTTCTPPRDHTTRRTSRRSRANHHDIERFHAPAWTTNPPAGAPTHPNVSSAPKLTA